jgi:chemotaxis protein MotB
MAGKGGAWKVAFADFMTAMMAFFLVMWLSAQDKEVLIATSRYFQNPFQSPFDSKTGLLNFDSNQSSSSSEKGKDPNAQNSGNTSAAQTIDLQFLNSVAKDVYRLLNLDDSLADKPIDVQVTSDGLRIILYDRSRRPLFEDGSARFTSWGDFVMQGMAWMIERNNFQVVIEGHTRSGVVFDQPEYSAWELTADRANAARRALVRYAVPGELVERVTGYADTRPIPLLERGSEANQRVTLSLRLGSRSTPPAAAGGDGAAKASPAPAGAESGGTAAAATSHSP